MAVKSPLCPSQSTVADPLSIPISKRLDSGGYYAHLTGLYRWYGSEPQGWHYGVWDPGIRSQRDALQRTNELMVQGLELRAHSHILDVGCGSGGFAAWVAQSFGCSVTGITNVPSHVRLAQEAARAAGVADRCRFLSMDMNAFGFERGQFDAILNEETFCYARDKPNYLVSLLPLLRPGGSWRAFAFGIRPGSRSTGEERSYREVMDGFHIPNLLPSEAVQAALELAGFADIGAEDLTSRVLPTAARIILFSYPPRLLSRLRLEAILYARDPVTRRFQRGHVAACLAYSRGLQKGLFRHYLYSGRKTESDLSRLPRAGPQA